MSPNNIHVFIIGWEGKLDRARDIAAAIVPFIPRVTVVYSQASETDVDGPGEWLRVPNADFFGKKFSRCLDAFTGGTFLLIHADTDFHDWGQLVRRCVAAFAELPNLGVWSPEISHTWWRTSTVELLPVSGMPGLISVAQTDGIVFALAPRVVDRLRQFDYSVNNLGWGIPLAAVVYARTAGLMICRDMTLSVSHDTSRGYRDEAAAAQMRAFQEQFTLVELDQLILLRSYATTRRREEDRWHSRIKRKFGRSVRSDPRSWLSG